MTINKYFGAVLVLDNFYLAIHAILLEKIVYTKKLLIFSRSVIIDQFKTSFYMINDVVRVCLTPC